MLVTIVSKSLWNYSRNPNAHPTRSCTAYNNEICSPRAALIDACTTPAVIFGSVFSSCALLRSLLRSITKEFTNIPSFQQSANYISNSHKLKWRKRELEQFPTNKQLWILISLTKECGHGKSASQKSCACGLNRVTRQPARESPQY